MKTAEEWIADGICGVFEHLTEEDCVRQVQADALRHAVAKCAKYGPNAERLLKQDAERLEKKKV